MLNTHMKILSATNDIQTPNFHRVIHQSCESILVLSMQMYHHHKS